MISPRTNSRTRMAIVGAGPGGLTAALSAARFGMEVTVFEAAADLVRVGGGIVLHQNGLRVLHRLELLDAFEPYINPCRSMVLSPGSGTEIRHSYAGAREPFDYFAVVLRYHLQEQLLAAARQVVPILTAHRCTSVDEEPGRVRLHFENGASADCDVVIGADGAHSRVRECMPSKTVVRHSGDAFLRGVSDVSLDRAEAREIWGRDGRRFGYAPLPRGQTYFYCSAPLVGWDEVVNHDLDAWILGWSVMDEHAIRILGHVQDWRAVNHDEPVQVQVERWSSARSFLIGDAAHAMTPDYGQGANSAMVDALVLTTLLATATTDRAALAAAGRDYQTIRRRFVDRTQAGAWSASRMARLRSPVAQRARNAVLQLVSSLPALQRRQLRLVTGDNPREAMFL